MRAARVGALLAIFVVVGLCIWGALTLLVGARRPPEAAIHTIHSVPGARLVVEDTEGIDLALEREAVLRATLPWSGRTVFSSMLAGPGSGSVELGAITRNVTARVPTVMRIPLSGAAASLARSCGRQELETVASGPDLQRAVADAQLAVAPPECGNFFSRTSFWNEPLSSNDAIDPRSAQLVRTFVGLADKLVAEHFYPNVNTWAYSVPIYTVPRDQPREAVILDNHAAYADVLRRAFDEGIPIPPGARPAAGLDEHLVVWQPATNTMWELWHARLIGGTWHADFGGEITDESQFSGAFFSPSGIELGATASSLALVGGLITLADVQRGVIDHAVAVAIPAARRSVWALPASRSDGIDPSPTAIPEGARLRLPASLNIAGLHLTPMGAMIARAVQRYGMIVRDQSGTVSFYGQDPIPSGSTIFQRLFATDPENVLQNFPWSDLQLMHMQLRTWGNRAVTS